MDNGVCIKCKFCSSSQWFTNKLLQRLQGLKVGFPSFTFAISSGGGKSRQIDEEIQFGMFFLKFKSRKWDSHHHLLFMDDVLILGIGSIEEWTYLKKIISSFCQATVMEVNCHK